MHLKSVGAGLFLGVLGGGLVIRAGAPPALAGLALLSAAGLVGLNLLELALWHKTIARIRQAVEGVPVRALLVGILTVLMGVLLASISAGTKVAPLSALFLVGCFSLALLGGVPAATAQLVGARLEPEAPLSRQTVVGTLVLFCAMLLPVVGWLLALGLVLTTLGGGVLSLARS